MAKITQTLVFEFDTEDQRQGVLAPLIHMAIAEECPRIVGLSSDDELKRSQLMFEALERYDDHYDLREAIASLADALDLSVWTWEKFENETA